MLTLSLSPESGLRLKIGQKMKSFFRFVSAIAESKVNLNSPVILHVRDGLIHYELSFAERKSLFCQSKRKQRNSDVNSYEFVLSEDS